jgi:hypothetical protein
MKLEELAWLIKYPKVMPRYAITNTTFRTSNEDWQDSISMFDNAKYLVLRKEDDEPERVKTDTQV